MADMADMEKEEKHGLLPAVSSPKGHGMSWQRGALTMIAEIVGTGVLGLAAAGARLGWAVAFSLLLFFGLFSLFSSLLLAAVHATHPAIDSYQTAALVLCGPRAARWTAVVVNLNWILVLPYFLMASANALSVAFWWRPQTCFYEWALLSAALVAGPAQIRSLEQLSTLSSASVGAIALVLALTACLLIAGGRQAHGESAQWSPPRGLELWDAFDSISAMTFAYQGQAMLFEIANEMQDRRDFGKAVKVSGVSLCALYAAAMSVGYYYRGASVDSFLPDALDDGPAKTVVGLVLYFHVVVTYLVNNQPLTKKLYAVCWAAADEPDDSAQGVSVGARARWAALSLALLGWSYLIANLVPWFSDFQNVLGSLLGAPIMFFFPVAFFLLDAAQAKPDKARATALFFVGAIILPLTWVVGTIAALQGLLRDWGEGGVFACKPSGYGR